MTSTFVTELYHDTRISLENTVDMANKLKNKE